jgi:MFS family permease
MYFMGWIIASMTLPRLSDIHGRLTIFIFGLVLNTIVGAVMLVSHNIWLTGFCLFLNGLTMTTRWSSGYILLCEIVPEKTQPIIGSIVQATGGFLLIYGTIVSYSTQNIIAVPALFLGVNVAGLIAIVLFEAVPESPRFLFS